MIIKLAIRMNPDRIPGMLVTTSTEVVVDSEEEAYQAGQDFNRFSIALMNGTSGSPRDYDDDDDDLDS